jgi:hypothetical protein
LIETYLMVVSSGLGKAVASLNHLWCPKCGESRPDLGIISQKIACVK